MARSASSGRLHCGINFVFKYTHDLIHHLVVAAPRLETRLFVATKWIFENVQQALVAVGAWRIKRPVPARLQIVGQLWIRQQRPCHGDSITIALSDCSGDAMGMLEA